MSMARPDLRQWLILFVGLICGVATAATLHGLGALA
jgi:hypothetical protein